MSTKLIPTTGATGAWIDWVPTYNGFTVGNATVTARYLQVDKIIYAYIKIVLGSTSSVSGDFSFTLPKNSKMAYPIPMGSASVEDTGSTMRPCFTVNSSVGLCTIRGINTAGTYSAEANFSSTVPQTWVSTDCIVANIVYEAA
jgi:hypothetical protein